MKKKVMASYAFWDNIDYLLKEKGSYLTELAESIGMEYGSLAIQKHRKTFPKYEQLISMADFFHLSLDDFMTVGNELSPLEQRLQRIEMRLPKASEEVIYCIEKLLDIPVEKKLPVGKSILTNDKSLEGKD